MSRADLTQPDPLERLEEALSRHLWWPQLTLVRVGDALDQFLAYQDRHRQFLVAHGLPPEPIPDAPWLFRRLACQYDTRMTRSPVPRGAGNGNPTPYEWVRWQDGQGETVRDPTEASFLNGLAEPDALRLERERSGFRHFKVAMLQLIRGACRPRPDTGSGGEDLLGACVDLTETQLGGDGLRFYLRLDRHFLGSDCAGGYLHGPTPHHPGGLTDLFDLVGEVLLEERERVSDRLLDAVPRRLRDDFFPRSAAVRHPHLSPEPTDPGREDGSLTSADEQALTAALAIVADGERRRYEWVVAFQDQLARRMSDLLGCEVAHLFPGRHSERRWALVEEYNRFLVDRANACAPLDAAFTPRDRPLWDARARTLWFRGVTTTYRAYGEDDSGTILAAFEGGGWAEVIDLPPPLAGRRDDGRWLSEKVRSLNNPLPPGMGMQFFHRAGEIGWRVSPGG